MAMNKLNEQYLLEAHFSILHIRVPGPVCGISTLILGKKSLVAIHKGKYTNIFHFFSQKFNHFILGVNGKRFFSVPFLTSSLKK